MDYWMVMKWNELVLDYNILMTNNEERCDMNKMLDRYENDVSIFYSQIKYYLGQNRIGCIFTL